MPSSTTPQFQELAILTRAVENVFRKLIRFLVGRLSLVKLQEMIRIIYVQESEKKLRTEDPGKHISLTQLAVLTGLDTRTLTKVRNGEGFWKPFHEETRFLKEMTPESCVLDLWSSDARFIDPKSGHPILLDIGEGDKSFGQVVSEAVTSRGVTVQSLLKKLISNNAVRLHQSTNKVELLGKDYAPYESGDAYRALELGLISAVVLLDTVFHNFSAVSEGRATYFQRGSWTHRLNAKDKKRFQKVIQEFLKKTDDDARKIIQPFEEKFSSNEQLTAGLSMFYFEDVSSLYSDGNRLTPAS